MEFALWIPVYIYACLFIYVSNYKTRTERDRKKMFTLTLNLLFPLFPDMGDYVKNENGWPAP